MSHSPYPPDYIKLPPAIACADVDDALIVTMARMLGLCWGYKYRRSPAYPPDELAELLGRPRTTLYRHLNRLQELGWLQVDRRDRRLVPARQRLVPCRRCVASAGAAAHARFSSFSCNEQCGRTII